MNYKKLPAHMFVVRVYCDCGEELKRTGICHLTYPATYEHECPKCNILYNLPKDYPTTEIEEIDPMKEVLD